MPLAGRYRVSDVLVQVNQVFLQAALEELGRAADDFQGGEGFGDKRKG